jgi:hypothetical protein
MGRKSEAINQRYPSIIRKSWLAIAQHRNRADSSCSRRTCLVWVTDGKLFSVLHN